MIKICIYIPWMEKIGRAYSTLWNILLNSFIKTLALPRKKLQSYKVWPESFWKCLSARLSASNLAKRLELVACRYDIENGASRWKDISLYCKAGESFYRPNTSLLSAFLLSMKSEIVR